MLVYGDHEELADPRLCIADVNRRLDAAECQAPGLQRHSEIVAALIEAGRVQQGIADWLFERELIDEKHRIATQLARDLLDLGRSICSSWDSGFADVGPLPRLKPEGHFPAEIRMRVPEGYAFYALYPEGFIEAARGLQLRAKPLVVGLRSIGSSLAAVVAAALSAMPPVTLRPFGDPAARQVRVGPALEADLLGGDFHYVIVDEGPGQSGSSFSAVADWLHARSVNDDRIAILSSHGGEPGPAATEERRRWWATVQRQSADFDGQWRSIIGRWSSHLSGQIDGIAEISGGAWRELHYEAAQDTPATVPAWERRKFLVETAECRLLLKFAGLGRVGEEKLAIARRLREEGLVPEPIGLIHGFLAERWHEEASPLGDGDKPIAEIAGYIGARARLLPAPTASGASAGKLLEMARRNIGLEFGEDFESALAPWHNRVADLERRIVRVRTDGKMEPHEWLRLADGRLLKTDALDHHQGHDLVGCQDVAWDVVGAATEFSFDDAAEDALVRGVADQVGPIDRELLDFYRLAYLAFRLGQWRMAEQVGATDERPRIRRRGDRYSRQLHHLLQRTTAGFRGNPRSVEARNEPAREQRFETIG